MTTNLFDIIDSVNRLYFELEKTKKDLADAQEQLRLASNAMCMDHDDGLDCLGDEA